MAGPLSRHRYVMSLVALQCSVALGREVASELGLGEVQSSEVRRQDSMGPCPTREVLSWAPSP